jgi:hypothetical protein
MRTTPRFASRSYRQQRRTFSPSIRQRPFKQFVGVNFDFKNRRGCLETTAALEPDSDVAVE